MAEASRLGPDLRRIRNDTLAGWLSAPGRFAVYGSGPEAEAVVGALGRIGLKPHALLDADRTGEVRGLEILPPEAVLDGLDHVILAHPWARDVTARLRADGYEGPVLDLDGALRFGAHHDVRALDAAADAIAFARSLLWDERSRHVFDAVLAHRRSLDPGDLPPETPAEGARAGEWVVDVGGGSPEAVLALAEAVGAGGRIHVLERDTVARSAVCDAIASDALGARVVVHALAAAGARRPRAEQDGALACASVDQLVREATAGRVDRLLVGAGAPPAATLAGAAAVLGERRPALAVALHRQPDDLWQLPIRIKERAPAYRLWLGHHAQALDGTVCHAAVPA